MLERRDLNKRGAYFMSCFVVSLRGGEGPVMDAAGLWHHVGKGREGPLAHVAIHLMDIFKGETGGIHHAHAVVNETSSKLKVRWWLERFNNELIMQGQINGPAICDEEGNMAQDSQYQETFVNFLT